jgi:hypothetical protein
LSPPDPFPSNFFSIGTLDNSQFNWYDKDLLPQTNVIHLLDGGDFPRTQVLPKPSSPVPNGKNVILRSSVRDEHSAYMKLLRIIRDQPNAMLQLLEVERAMLEHNVEYSPRSVKNEVIIFLANAWTKDGNGLFDNSLRGNFDIALDLAISQIVLPIGWKAIRRSTRLRRRLGEVLSDKYVYSRKILDLSDISCSQDPWSSTN